MIDNTTVKQPKLIEMPFSFMCSHCKKESARITTREELKEDFVGDTRILVEYIEDTETFEGNWFEITEEPKRGLKIATCNCENSNEGQKIFDGMMVKYFYKDEEFTDGIYLDSIVRINKKDTKKSWRFSKIKLPK